MKLFEAELDGCYFILRTDHKYLTYINATFVGKILQDKNFSLEHVPDALSRLCVNNMPDNKSGPNRRPMMATLAALQPIQKIPQLNYKRLAECTTLRLDTGACRNANNA